MIANNFQGKEGQSIPELKGDFINSVSDRYIELYNSITGNSFQKADTNNILDRIEHNVINALSNL